MKNKKQARNMRTDGANVNIMLTHNTLIMRFRFNLSDSESCEGVNKIAKDTIKDKNIPMYPINIEGTHTNRIVTSMRCVDDAWLAR